MYKTLFHKQDLKNYSFLITGGAGFIGSNIVEYLLKHNAGKVRVLDNLSTGFKKNIEPFLSLPNFEFIEEDICDLATCQKACTGIDFVSHQAALGSVPRSVKNPLATHEVNVTGFLNMLIAARDEQVKRFIYASSSSVYGDSKTLPKTEDKIGNPLSPYAVTKQTDELYAKVFALNYGMKIIGLRYFNVFGPRQSPEGAYAAAIPLFMDALLKNQSPYINGDGEQTRDFTFVENAIQANVRAFFASDDATKKTYNVAVGDRISVNELFKTIQRHVGSAKEAIHREERAGDIKDSLADISLAKKYLKYSPTIKFSEGIKITLEWFKAVK